MSSPPERHLIIGSGNSLRSIQTYESKRTFVQRGNHGARPGVRPWTCPVRWPIDALVSPLREPKITIKTYGEVWYGRQVRFATMTRLRKGDRVWLRMNRKRKPYGQAIVRKKFRGVNAYLAERMID